MRGFSSDYEVGPGDLLDIQVNTSHFALGSVGAMKTIASITGDELVREPDGSVSAIVEHKDATEEQLGINEVNTGLLACPVNQLKPWLDAMVRTKLLVDDSPAHCRDTYDQKRGARDELLVEIREAL